MKLRITLLAASLLTANAAIAATEVKLQQQPASYLNTSQDIKAGIKVIRSETDFNGTTHTHIQQTYNGVPVWGAAGVIHTAKQKSRAVSNATMNGVVYEDLAKDLAQTPATALTRAQGEQAVAVAKNAFMKRRRMAGGTLKGEKSQLIVYVDENNVAHYAYLTSFDYNTPSQAHRPTSIIDAQTHKIYRTWEGLLFADANTEAAISEARAKLHGMLNGDDDQPPVEMYDIKAGGIGGNVKEGEIIYDDGEGHQPSFHIKAMDMVIEPIPGKLYTLTICALMNDDISVYDMSYGDVVSTNCIPDFKEHNGVAWLSRDRGYTRWEDDEMNDGYSPSLDAFYAATAIKNMYQDWYNVPALINEDGSPMQYMMRVHFGRKFDNAFWDGQQMTFGDGGKMFYPMTSYGVTAHEISHGFTDTHSHIDGSNPEMAALHESFSDMAAVALENYLTGSNKWDIGREVMKNEGALRYLDNPTKDGSSIDNMKDFDATEAHAGAGITNKAFYLLATTKGWNTHKAFDVWVKANMNYWNASMKTLNEAACGVVAATKDYGYSVTDVRIAFAKVGIDTDNCDITG